MTSGSPMSRVLITGGGGFLGAWILKDLTARDITVRVFELTENRARIDLIAPEANGNTEWVQGDVIDTQTVLDATDGCDAVIHLAGLMTPACKADPLLGARVNVLGTLNVFEAAKAHGIRKVVYTSSGGVYGMEDKMPPFAHTHYGTFKLANEGNARAYWADDRISSIGFRPFVIYGPGRDAGLTADISMACAAAAKGEAYTIGLSGPMSLVYVEDVARAYFQALLQNIKGAHVANLTGQQSTVEQVAKLIREIVPGAPIRNSGDPIPSAAGAENHWTTCGLDLPPEHSLRPGAGKDNCVFQRQLTLSNRQTSNRFAQSRISRFCKVRDRRDQLFARAGAPADAVEWHRAAWCPPSEWQSTTLAHASSSRTRPAN